jgi:hypothetical protein
LSSDDDGRQFLSPRTGIAQMSPERHGFLRLKRPQLSGPALSAEFGRTRNPSTIATELTAARLTQRVRTSRADPEKAEREQWESDDIKYGFECVVGNDIDTATAAS